MALILAGTPAPLHPPHVLLELIARHAPGVVRGPGAPHSAAIEDQAGHSMRVCRGEQSRHLAAFGVSEEHGSLRPCLVHHGADVVHPGLEIRKFASRASSHIMSTFEIQPGTYTRSGGPPPAIW